LNSIAETASLGCGRKPAVSEPQATNMILRGIPSARDFLPGARKKDAGRLPGTR